MTKSFSLKHWICSLWFLQLLISVRSGRLSQRDLPPLQTVQIPLTLSSNGKYSVDVTMGPKSPQPQQFKFALSTSTGFTYVGGQNCSSCLGPSTYNVGASTSVKQLSGRQNVSVLDQSASGSLIKEDCTLKTKNGSAWSYPNQTIVVADSSSFTNSSGISGLIGLGTNPTGNFSDTVFGGWLGRNPARSNFSYGMQLNKPSTNTSSLDGGLLHWITPDTSAYQGEVAYKKMIPRNSTTNATNGVASADHALNAEWSLDLDSFSFNTGSGAFSQSAPGMKAILDPYFPDIYFPQTYAKLIYASVTGAAVSSQSTSSINVYSLPCDQKLSLSLTFGTFTITLDQDNLIKTLTDGTCVGTVQEWSDPGVTEFLLGSSFISSVYLIFVISQAEASVGFAARSVPQEPGLSKGAIAGIAVGSAVGAGLIVGAIVFLFLRRKYRRRQPGRSSVREIEPETKGGDPREIHPFPPSPPNSARPLMTSNTPPATPQSPDYRHISYATYSAGALTGTGSHSQTSQQPPGLLDVIPDSPPPYLHSGQPLPFTATETTPTSGLTPRRRKELEAGGRLPSNSSGGPPTPPAVA